MRLMTTSSVFDAPGDTENTQVLRLTRDDVINRVRDKLMMPVHSELQRVSEFEEVAREEEMISEQSSRATASR